MGRNDEAWAVFWCSLLSPVLLGEIPEHERGRYFRELSREERALPNGCRGHLSVRTLQRKWIQLRDRNVQGLFRRRRNDLGKSRKRRAKMLARAVALKKEQPRRSAVVINRILKAEFGSEVPRSTLHRHLRQAGATRLKLGVSKKKVRVRWTRDLANALWVGDFEHGPMVVHDGRAIKTHLSAWIDCHSRYIVEARYYIRENLDILVDSLLRAWSRHGASRELYVDNAKIYHSSALKLATTQLNIKLLHRPPRDPPAGGLIERFFETGQSQFEAEVRAARILTLDQLNLDFANWLRLAYHRERHDGTGQTPLERYEHGSRFTRHVNLQEVIKFFHRRERRTVNDDFSDVQVGRRFFKVDPRLRGDKLIVAYDPFSPPDEVQLYSPDGRHLGRAPRYEREPGSHEQPPAPEEGDPIEPTYLNVLREEADAEHRRQRASGIDYHSARRRNVWSLTGLANKFARLLGRKGGASALSAEELEVLGAFHRRHERVTESLVEQAFEAAETPAIPEILFHLQSLLHERNP